MKLLFLFIVLNLLHSGLQVKRKTKAKTKRQGHKEDDRVVGRTKVEDIREYLFVGALVELQGHITMFLCGSAIISNNWALTSAHCLDRQFDGAFNKGTAVVRDNTTQWKYYGGDDHHVIKKFVHNLNRKQMLFDYDVALLKVHEPFQHRSQISLVPEKFKYSTGLRATVIGWGTDVKSGNGGPRDDLYYVEVIIGTWETCKTHYQGKLTGSMFCAGNHLKDACTYDSGSPIYYYNETSQRRFVIGLVSFGVDGKCGTSLYTGVYANLAKASEWIGGKIADERRKNPEKC